jgi:hypothetical protein
VRNKTPSNSLEEGRERYRNSELRRFSGVFLCRGEIRQLTFEARDAVEARELAERWNIGVKGETNIPEEISRFMPSLEIPEAYNVRRPHRCGPTTDLPLGYRRHFRCRRWQNKAGSGDAQVYEYRVVRRPS